MKNSGTVTPYNILVTGTGGVGKSAIVNRFVNGIFLKVYEPTMEDIYPYTLEHNDNFYQLNIVDTAGTEAFGDLSLLMVKDGHGFLLVYNITSQSSFDELRTWRKRIKKIKRGTDFPMIVVGNKSDLEDKRVVSTKDGAAQAKEWGYAFIETSALNNINLAKTFKLLVDDIEQNPAVKKNLKESSGPPEDKKLLKKLCVLF
eukprot:TRINITY_DN5078_c0_g1_i1.p1 TRINITY_DN5078_c0_g1~~TRINITY_DN5078_c0_g1_i1.p1  ORF type:complete len:201 (+),score=35.60 TRINITY_DN5078_c0_g1_i1:54-656(+)